MSNKVLLKRSSVAGKVPASLDLEYGELALNYTDGKLYFKNNSNTIQSIVPSVTLDDVTSNGNITTNSITVGELSIGSAYTLPTNDGIQNYVLATDGNGNVSWSSVGSLANAGIGYGDLSVTTNAPGTPSLSYNNGVFTYTPPDLSSYLTVETDPIYTASSWYTTTNNSINWDTAYNWGDHSTAGYLTSETNTAISYNIGTTTLTYTDELGNNTNIDLSGLLDEDARAIASGTLN